uniref:Uncharacterized protein n=1 Tax=candidate division WOR-3 bacterium TaxID=2052148 RepID=A0A7C4UCB3_UNCW3
MKRFLLVFVLFVVVGIFAKPAKVFIVNLFNESVDVRLGESDNPVVHKYNLKPYSSTKLARTEKYGDYILYFKLSDSLNWYRWADEDGNVLYCSVKKDKNYCILIGNDGGINYYSLSEDNEKGPKIAFLNGSDKRVKRMEISKKWKDNVQAYCVDFDPNDLSNLVSFKKGNYSMFWQFPSQVKEDDYYYYPNEERTGPEVFKFVDGEYDLFLIYSIGDSEYGILYEITPQD